MLEIKKKVRKAYICGLWFTFIQISRGLVLNVSIRELKYYKWIGYHRKDKSINLNRLSKNDWLLGITIDELLLILLKTVYRYQINLC